MIVFFSHQYEIHKTYFLTELSDPNPKTIYLEMDEKMDRMANWTYFILAKLTFPIFVSSNLLLTVVNYFVLDMGDDSYFLPSPILYALLYIVNYSKI